MKNLVTLCLFLLVSLSLKAQSTKKDSVIIAPIQPVSCPMTTPIDDSFAYGRAQVPPQFRGDIKKYIADSIKYPENVRIDKIEGMVYLSVVIEKNGSVTHIKILRSPDPDLTNEAIRVVSRMPKWISGRNNGVPIRVQQVIPVKFVLGS